LKPVSQKRINRVLDDLKPQQEQITILSNRQKKDILLNDIVYIEFQKNKLVFKTEKGEYSTYQSYSEFKLDLSAAFCQCHKSYIANMGKVVQRYSNKCLLFNGEDIPVGRKYAQEFKNAYFKYLRELHK
jgi:DNA-binding LytR/AlgR family response regulator